MTRLHSILQCGTFNSSSCSARSTVAGFTAEVVEEELVGCTLDIVTLSDVLTQSSDDVALIDWVDWL